MQKAVFTILGRKIRNTRFPHVGIGYFTTYAAYILIGNSKCLYQFIDLGHFIDI